jgi:hypothetical protein
LERLDANGVFSYVMYSTRHDLVEDLVAGERGAQPYIPALRTLTGLRLALQKIEPNARFGDHVLIAALPRVINPDYDLVHIVVGRRPFAQDERSAFVAACERLGFIALHPTDPAATPDPPNLYTRISTADDLTPLALSLPFGIWPATDDRPFQYALEARHLVRAFGRGELLAILAGNPLVSLGVSIGTLAALLTLLPIVVSRRRVENLQAFRSNYAMLIYFACIGFAYMGVEIAALLRLQSFLGKPIYGLSVGLFAFLLASGLGSNTTGRIPDARLVANARRVVGAIFGIGLVFVAFSDDLFTATVALPLAARVAIAVTAIFPLAFPMGMLFPIGIRLIAQRSEDLIPWAWATNGCFSVLGIFSTRITALLFGFSRAFVVGLLAYLLVLAWVRRGASEPTALSR